MPNKLINEHAVDLRNLEPYWFVVDGEATDSCLPVPPNEVDGMCSALWRGYIASLKLHADGRLELLRYEYPFTIRGARIQQVHRFFGGDFQLCFRPFFEGPNTHVAFRDGRIVADRQQWAIDEQAMSAKIESVERNSETGTFLGLKLAHHFFWNWWMPANLIPKALHADIDAHVGETVDCVIEDMQEDRCVVVVRPRTKVDEQTGAQSFCSDIELAARIGARIDGDRVTNLRYSPGKLLLRDSAINPPQRKSQTRWLVYKNDDRPFEIEYDTLTENYRVKVGNLANEFDSIAGVFDFLDLQAQ